MIAISNPNMDTTDSSKASRCMGDLIPLMFIKEYNIVTGSEIINPRRYFPKSGRVQNTFSHLQKVCFVLVNYFVHIQNVLYAKKIV